MRDADKRLGRGIAFISGAVLGSVIGAAAVFLIAVPSGKKVLRDLQEESISLKGKSGTLIQAARQKSIELGRTLSLQGRSSDTGEQMIPIPRDYVRTDGK